MVHTPVVAMLYGSRHTVVLVIASDRISYVLHISPLDTVRVDWLMVERRSTPYRISGLHGCGGPRDQLHVAH